MMFKVYSHMRSGTEWFIEILKLNFYEGPVEKSRFYIKKGGHRPIENEQSRFSPAGLNNLYIVRDGRDAIVSSYYYWLNNGSPRFKIKEAMDKNDINFSQFLRGETPIEKIKGRRNHVLDPVCHWVDHTRWIYYVYTVRYEDLQNNLQKTIYDISEEFDEPLIRSKPETIEELVGVKPRKGIVGDWKNHFSEDDLDYFWQKAGHRMLELGYKK